MADNVTSEKDLWVIIPSRWVRKWLTFALLKQSDAPGPIPTATLLTRIKAPSDAFLHSPPPLSSSSSALSTLWRVKRKLLPPSYATNQYEDDFPGHYRRISIEAWLVLVELYGVSGPAIAVVKPIYLYYLL